MPNAMDPPDHAAWRALVDSFFAPPLIATLEPRVRGIAEAAVAALPRRSAVDAVAQLGNPFAVRAQTEWLGWQGIEDELLAWMADNHAATRSGDRMRNAAVAAAFDEIIRAQLRRRREQGAAAPTDPTTTLLAATVDGRPLGEADIVSILRNWAAGDLASMATAIGVAVWSLATHPDVQQELRQHPEGLASAIDEMLRIDDPFLVNRRVTTRAARNGGHELAAGTRVYLNGCSANRDEAVFGDPDAYRPERNAHRNLVYGTGIHACPGPPLATMELVTVAQAVLAGHTVLFVTAGHLLGDLAALDSDSTLRRRLRHYAAPDVLLIVSVQPPHLDRTGARGYRGAVAAPTKATHSTRLSAPSMRNFSASVRTASKSCSPRYP